MLASVVDAPVNNSHYSREWDVFSLAAILAKKKPRIPGWQQTYCHGRSRYILEDQRLLPSESSTDG